MLDREEMLKVYAEKLHNLWRYGSLRVKCCGGGGSFTIVDCSTGRKYKEKKYNKEKTRLKIAAFKYYKEAIRRLENGATAMEVEPNRLRLEMPRAYQELPKSVYETADVINIEEWLLEEREYSKSKPEHKKHHTHAGWVVRSKSERMMSNEMLDLGIPHLYEPIDEINGREMESDYQVLDVRDYQIKKGEHLGIMDDQHYQMTSSWRLKNYAKEGTVPGVDVFITMEWNDLPLDREYFLKVLEFHFGPLENYAVFRELLKRTYERMRELGRFDF